MKSNPSRPGGEGTAYLLSGTFSIFILFLSTSLIVTLAVIYRTYAMSYDAAADHESYFRTKKKNCTEICKE